MATMIVASSGSRVVRQQPLGSQQGQPLGAFLDCGGLLGRDVGQ